MNHIVAPTEDTVVRRRRARRGGPTPARRTKANRLAMPSRWRNMMTSVPVAQAEALIFLHIPKTGGTTLQNIIEQNYSPGQVHRHAGRLEFKKLTERQKRSYHVISGHLYFGIHREIPQSTAYFTMLRDPVDRIISNYYYVLRAKDHRLHQRINAEKMSLADYVTSKLNSQLDNGQLRLLSGIEEDIPFGGCSSAMLDRAKENLKRHFTVIGLTERFDDSLRLMKECFGWKNISYQKANVTVDRPARTQIDPETLQLIESCNVFDLELYRFAQAALDAQLQRSQA